ncbi:DUF5659 domain-containing protein [Clostridium hydrogeniformans]|uniref:DUF5659 domain-containing protein n=1 Tax=Clostridium hydrogeniformans TaxID=349933 RepID=UPI000489E87F|nr:DUF5659 domain-containing protein [Clostridium hydrogeniformans]
MKLKGITDKDLIVYLVAIGLEIKDIRKAENKSIVYFEDNDRLKKSFFKYVNKTDYINLSDFIWAERRIKTLLCAQKHK